jgi:hypothetical protein
MSYRIFLSVLSFAAIKNFPFFSTNAEKSPSNSKVVLHRPFHKIGPLHLPFVFTAFRVMKILFKLFFESNSSHRTTNRFHTCSRMFGYASYGGDNKLENQNNKDPPKKANNEQGFFPFQLVLLPP